MKRWEVTIVADDPCCGTSLTFEAEHAELADFCRDGSALQVIIHLSGIVVRLKFRDGVRDLREVCPANANGLLS